MDWSCAALIHDESIIERDQSVAARHVGDELQPRVVLLVNRSAAQR
jgi:hypothetical protein